MTLYNGEMHEIDKNTRKEYRRVEFQKHKVLLDASGFGFQRSDESTVSRGDRELSASTMLGICDSLQAQIDARKQRIAQSSTTLLERMLTGTPFPSLDSLKFADSLSLHTQPYPTDTLFYLSSIPKTSHIEMIDMATSLGRTVQNETSNSLFSIRNDLEMQRKYMVEVHKKFSIPFACFCFVLVGVPLGVLAKRGGFGIGAGLSLAFFLMYWAFLISGEKLADRGIVSPSVAMWAGNAVLIVIGAGAILGSFRYRLSVAHRRRTITSHFSTPLSTNVENLTVQNRSKARPDLARETHFIHNFHPFVDKSVGFA
jgi:lipopolysaccharide export system permease protein